MSYILKEDNTFYGSKGNKISNQLYNRLPTHHQLLFEKYNFNNNDFDELMDSITKVVNKFNNVVPKPVAINEHEDIAFRNDFYNNVLELVEGNNNNQEIPF